MRKYPSPLCRILFAALVPGIAIAHADTITFSLEPASGNIEGPAGSTIGWGYSITNNSTADWLVTTDLNADPFADGSPDASPFDFPVIAPGATVSLFYDPDAHTGLFALTWDVSAPTGFSNSGVFTLDAEWWTGNPLSGGTFIQDAPQETAAYSAVVSNESSSVPEPNCLMLITPVLLVILTFCKRGAPSGRRSVRRRSIDLTPF